MAWYWLILGYVLSGLLGFFICAIAFTGSEADDHMLSFSEKEIESMLVNGTRAERRRRWRERWRDMTR